MSFLRLLLDSMWNCLSCEQAEMEAVTAPGQNNGQPQSQCNTTASSGHAFPPMAAPNGHVAMDAVHARSLPCSTMIRSITSGTTSAAGTVACPDPEEGTVLEVPNLRIFTFAELRAATRNFKPDNIIGEGGFGCVYKGWMNEKTTNASSSGTRSATVVAVKRLNPESPQGLQEWQSEVNFLGRMSHPNLVRLLGYCMEERELLLVYEFMAKGSLDNHLFRRQGGSVQPIPWGLRLRIAIGAARGLAFLHTSETHVIYRDFKSSNILLDTHYNPKISDFGLAKNGPAEGHSHITTGIMGTFGYAAPEYVSSGHLCVKSDVYGFGVVLLEMLTGMRALDTARPAPQVNLVNWAKPYLTVRRRVAQLVDPHLEGQYTDDAALSVAQLTLSCLSDDPKSRPSMAEVAAALEKIDRMKPPPYGLASTGRTVHGHRRTPLRQGGRLNLSL